MNSPLSTENQSPTSADLIDKAAEAIDQGILKLPRGISSALSRVLVETIVNAAVARIRESADRAESGGP